MLAPMSIVQRLAEERVAEAIAAGELDDLPGRGRPLELDDDRMVPPELRAGYRLLRNAGFLPPELELHGEIARVEQLLAMSDCPAERRGAMARLEILRSRVASSGRRRGSLLDDPAYQARLLRRLDRED